ncbi:MAG: carboxylating nicotinate-nucleotide diphosphorylase [Ignavibacteria bacterium]
MNYYKDFDLKEAGRLIRLALMEDIGKGDVTSELLISPYSNSKAELLIKENGIIAGLKIFEYVFSIIDKKIKVKFKTKDGQKVRKGEVIGSVQGNTRKLLKGERVALNLLQRMSGIATYTNFLVRKLNNNSIKIIDTRKTTPNLRIFEKLGVLTGGGENHRFGLYDMILIKDNHIEANGGISKTLDILAARKKKLKQMIEIEVKNIKEFELVVSKGRDIISRVMLDNFRLENVKKAVKLNNNLFEIEISGGINEKNISRYRNIKGIDFISIGSVTHSVNSMDISLNFIT